MRSDVWIPIKPTGPPPSVPISLEDLDLPAHDSVHASDHEEMPVKARKRGRGNGDSDSEVIKKSLVEDDASDPSDYESASETGDEDSIPDTTVDVTINPDASSTPLILSNNSVENTTSLPECVTSHSSDHIEDFTPTPPPGVVYEVSTVPNDVGAQNPPGDGAMDAAHPPITPSTLVNKQLVDQSKLLSEGPERISSDNIEDFTPSLPPVVETPKDSNDIGSLESSGDRAAAVVPITQQHTDSPDVVPPPLPVLNSTEVPITGEGGSVPVTSHSDKGDLTVDLPLTLSTEEADIPGHEVWDDDGCSSFLASPPHTNDHSAGERLPALSSESDLDSLACTSSPGSLFGKEEDIREQIEALLSMQREHPGGNPGPPS